MRGIDHSDRTQHTAPIILCRQPMFGKQVGAPPLHARWPLPPTDQDDNPNDHGSDADLDSTVPVERAEHWRQYTRPASGAPMPVLCFRGVEEHAVGIRRCQMPASFERRPSDAANWPRSLSDPEVREQLRVWAEEFAGLAQATDQVPSPTALKTEPY